MSEDPWAQLNAEKDEALDRLLQNIKASRAELAKLLQEVDVDWVAEDLFYRFYHYSFKVYCVQAVTKKILKALSDLNPRPEIPLNAWFMEIVEQGTGREFQMSDNDNWTALTRPMLEAFFHARTFLALAVKYTDLEAPPSFMPAGWAALTYLYRLR